MKIAVAVLAVGAFIYLLYHQLSRTQAASVPPIVKTPFTPVPNTFFNQGFFPSPSPIIKNGSLPTLGASTAAELTTGPTYAQAGITPDLPLTASSPSLLVPLMGSPAVTDPSAPPDVLDYPGVQTYMSDPNASDPNAPLAVYT